MRSLEKLFTASLVFFLGMSLDAQASDEELAARLDAAVKALNNAAQILNTHKDAVTELQAEIEKLKNIQNTIPSDAVVAFDAANRCPEGWSDFVDGQGRVILGASFGVPDTLFRIDTLPQYMYRDHGGKTVVALTKDELPMHTHEVGTIGLNFGGQRFYAEKPNSGGDNFIDIAWYIDGSSAEIEELHSGIVAAAGKSRAHENMPPYVALYLCKKN